MGILARMMGREPTVNLAQPDYGNKRDLPNASAPDGIEIGAEQPVSYNTLAGGIDKWEDMLLDLDAEAYTKMRVCHAIRKPLRKLAIRTAKLNWTVVGEGERAEAIKEIFGQISNWGDFIEWMTWALVEGVRFYQIKRAKPAKGMEGGKYVAPDFFMGGRLKKNAGGEIEWAGNDTLVLEENTTGQNTRPAEDLPRDQFAIHRPGGGSNPEGDLWLGVTLYNAVALPCTRGITSGDLWMRLFAIPAILAGASVQKSRPDQIQARFQGIAAAAARAMGTGNVTALDNDSLIKLLQADPNGLKGITEWLRYLESIADDMLTLGVLTSSSGISDANRTGNTETHRDENDEAAFANGVQIAETFNRDVLPWIIARNTDLPPLGEDEDEVYLWPNDPSETDEQDVETDTEGVDDTPDAGEDDETPEALLQQLQQAVHAKGDHASVSLAANVRPVPPVH